MNSIHAWKRTERLAMRSTSLARLVKEYRLYFFDQAAWDHPHDFVASAKKEVDEHLSIFIETLRGLGRLVQDPTADVRNVFREKLDTEGAIKAVYGQMDRFRALHRLIAEGSIPAAGYPQDEE